MAKKLFLGLLTISLLIFTLIQLSRSETQASTLPGWQVDDGGGFYSESNGVIRLWSNGGNDSPYDGGPYIGLYKQISPTGDFSFSVQINANTIEGGSVNLRSSLPAAGKQEGVCFEFGTYDTGIFSLSRNTNYSFSNQIPFGGASHWTVSQIVQGHLNIWYTMQLNVTKSPYTITASVFDANGTLLGSQSTSDISDLTFDDINFVGLHVWGYSPADYLFRNIQDPFANPAVITISTNSSSATAGSAVEVFGTLFDSNGAPLQNRTVVLSYTFPGADTWIPISSDFTDEQSNYDIQWINSASGTFTLKTEWSGDSTYMGASNTTALSFLPYQNQQVFFVESNSTVSALAFDNETATLSFNVTGPSGTSGFVKATIAKSLLTNGENLQTYIDGKQLAYSVTSSGDSWVYYFNYSHSTHQISMQLNSAQLPQPSGNEIILIAIVATLGATVAIEVYSVIRKKKLKSEVPLTLKRK